MLALSVHGKGRNDSRIDDESNEERNGTLQIKVIISFLYLIFTLVVNFSAQDQS